MKDYIIYSTKIEIYLTFNQITALKKHFCLRIHILV